MIRFITTALIVAILGCCSSHLALLAMNKEQSNQQRYIDEYDAQMQEMEAKDYN